jgi:phosphoadenosine phosphosulfate reductase
MIGAKPIDEQTGANWSPERLQALNETFARQPAQDLVAWALASFAPDIALGTGFGPSGIVIMHMVATLRPDTTIFYLDTGALFIRTYQLCHTLETQLGITLTPVRSDMSLEKQAAVYGSALWQRDPDLCCHLRKVQPLRHFLAGKQAWITGVRRDQTETRANVQLLEWNHSNEVVKINPLAFWSESQVWSYIDEHKLPYNPLHDQGYPTLGCVPCTSRVSADEDSRAGRWRGHEKLECGLHFENGNIQPRR